LNPIPTYAGFRGELYKFCTAHWLPDQMVKNKPISALRKNRKRKNQEPDRLVRKPSFAN